MSIPNIPKFAKFLSTIQTYHYKQDAMKTVVIPATRGRDHRDNLLEIEERLLWHESNIDGLTLESVLTKIEDTLKKTTSLSNRRCATAVLFIYAMLQRTEANAVVILNQILNTIATAKVQQYVSLPVNIPSERKVSFGSFEVGAFPSAILKKSCNHCGSDYYDLYGRQLDGRFGIVRNPYDTNIIDWQSLGDVLNITSQFPPQREGNIRRTILDYFEGVTEVLFQNFWNSFETEQDALVATENIYIDRELFQNLPAQTMVATFEISAPKSWGFVVPYMGAIEVAFGQGSLEDPIISKLQAQGLSSPFAASLPPILKTYIRFMARARKHYKKERFDDAFLHYVIALDLLLGEKDASNKAIGSRVAVLTHRILTGDYNKQREQVRSLYEYRSRYVHEGAHVPLESLTHADSICSRVLECLLRLYRHHNLMDKEFFIKWSKKLDHIATGLEAGVHVPEEQFIDCGIADIEALTEN